MTAVQLDAQEQPPGRAAAIEQLITARRNRQLRRVGILVLLMAIVLVLCASCLMWGETFYNPGEVWAVIRGEHIPGASFAVGELRLPRTVLGLFAGLAFGAAGATFQIMLRNQLASPDTIGIDSGAAAAAVIGLVLLRTSEFTVSVMALAGSLTVTFSIYLLAYRKGYSGTRMILIGIGIASILDSVVTYVLSKASAWDLQAATRWLTGSLNGAGWQTVGPVVATCLVFLPILYALGRYLSLLLLGEESAVGLGVRVTAIRVAAIGCAVILVAVATAACGPIAFVAFMSGPIAIRLLGSAASPLLGASLIGAILVLGSDFLGQWAFGTRYPVGVITGILGAPYLIHLLIRANRLGATL